MIVPVSEHEQIVKTEKRRRRGKNKKPVKPPTSATTVWPPYHMYM
jgi:hypothetical protein